MPLRKVRERQRQTKINFSRASESSPSSKHPTTAAMGNSPSTPAQNTESASGKKKTRQATRAAQVDSSSENEWTAEIDHGMRLGMPVKHTPQGMFGTSDVGLASYPNYGDEDKFKEQVKAKPASRKRQRAEHNSAIDEDESRITDVSEKRQRRQPTQIDNEEEQAEKSRTKRRKTACQTMPQKVMVERPTPPSTRPGATRKLSLSDNEVVVVVPRSLRRRATRRETIPDDEEDEEEQKQPQSKNRRAVQNESSSEDEVAERTPPRSARRRIIRRNRTPDSDEEEVDGVDDVEEGNAHNNDDIVDEEQDDLKEDLAFLQSSPPLDRGRLRSTQDKPKSQRQKALEALIKKRAGTNESLSAATPVRRHHVIQESDSESESELEIIKEERDSDLEILDPIEDDSQSEDPNSSSASRPANAFDMFLEDDNDQNFIDDNAEANTLGEPSIASDLDELRLANSLSRAKSKDLFKHAIEWMVMKVIHPAFNSEHQVYVVSFRKLDDEVKGLAGSKYTSAAWSPAFTRAIKARPDAFFDDISHAMQKVAAPYCEACNRPNHAASTELTLSGSPYDAETLEALHSSDSDSSSLSDDDDDDSLLPEEHIFPLGSTCRANARVAHTLYHWRYHLFSWVKSYLSEQGHLSAAELVKRSKWSARKCEQRAQKIVDKMESDREVLKLYRMYKDQVQYAMEADNSCRRRWGKG